MIDKVRSVRQNPRLLCGGHSDRRFGNTLRSGRDAFAVCLPEPKGRSWEYHATADPILPGWIVALGDLESDFRKDGGVHKGLRRSS